MEAIPETARENRWILVVTDHFTRWQDATPIPKTTAPVGAPTLDARIFSYFGLPEELHSDQGAQFESKLLEELCLLWRIEKTSTTPYHPLENGVVERNNKGLGDSLRVLLPSRKPTEWGLLLPHIMRAFRRTSHSVTEETANFMMMGRELKLPDQLSNAVYQLPMSVVPYIQDLVGQLKEAHEVLREQQMKIREKDSEEPPLFSKGDHVWLVNKRRGEGKNPQTTTKICWTIHYSKELC